MYQQPFEFTPPLFASCKHRRQSDTYKCCLSHCASTSPECVIMCNDIFPATIMEDCALEKGCYANGFDETCLVAQAKSIQACCLHKCKTRQFASRGISAVLKHQPIEDCQDYCNGYQLPRPRT